MTTLAMIFGMLPLALGLGEGASQRAPMAHAVIGGVITSTLLTLVVVPVVLVYIDRVGRLGAASASAASADTGRRSPQARRVNSADGPIPGTIRAMLGPCRMTPDHRPAGRQIAFRGRSRAMGRLRAGAGLGRQPVPQLPLPEGAGGFQVGRPAHRLAAAISAGRNATTAPCRAPCRSTSRATARANTSSTTAGRRPSSAPAAATIPSSRSAVPFTPVPGPRLFARPGPYADGVRDAHDRHAGQDRRRQSHQLGPRHLLHRGRLEALRRRTAGCCGCGQQYHWHNDGYRTLRRFPGRARLAQAQGDPQGARGRAARGPERARAERRRDQARALGRLLRLLPGHRRPQVGLALPHARLLRHPGRAPWPTRWCW